MSTKEFHESQTCRCQVPNSTGPLDGGVEVCMTCSYEIRPRTVEDASFCNGSKGCTAKQHANDCPKWEA